MIFENKKILFLFSLVFMLFFSLLTFLFSNAFFMADDPSECYMLEFNIKELFLHPYNYNLFSGFCCKLFGFYLPKLINIHPSDFKSFYFCYIESALFLSTLFVICKLYYQKKKIDYAFILFFALSICLFFLCLTLKDMLIWIYPGLFRMLFPTFFFIILSLLIANIIKKKEISKLEKIFIICLTLLCTTSNEMIAAATILMYIILLVCFLRTKSNLIEKKFLIITLIVSLLGVLSYHFAFFRKTTDINVFSFNYLINLFPLLGEFIKGYLELIIFNQIIPLLTIIISSFLLIKKGSEKQENLNIVSFVLISVISFLIFFFLLFILGKTHYQGGFWLEHTELMVLFNMVLIAEIFIIFRQILQQKIISKKYFIIFSLVCSLIIGLYDFNFFREIHKEMGKQRKETYKLEKMYRLAALKKRVALLPDSTLKIGYLWCYFAADWKNLNRFKNNIHFDSTFISFYRTFEEKDIFTEGFLYIPKFEAYEDFQKNGGNLTAKELNNIQFTRLLDENFLSNNI